MVLETVRKIEIGSFEILRDHWDSRERISRLRSPTFLRTRMDSIDLMQEYKISTHANKQQQTHKKKLVAHNIHIKRKFDSRLNRIVRGDEHALSTEAFWMELKNPINKAMSRERHIEMNEGAIAISRSSYGVASHARNLDTYTTITIKG
ncbi:uncharacterized protein EAE97_002435 [Botrytis byssoidea]|uniref:Uncharacterized protein n=1 Tax=Botrytis byssoidea TaxID=139641 RepID=A0A9P5M5A7_9HELO|nr:uncharacterized protein EAE97_002435 [Botrytis byssoidea]KAF7950883.1 hypothetical protein EAE97_002435 [Botrytis byssoidea]